ncbi:membrane protein [Streptomyces sp. MUSC 125]|uniref:hypothetical protein n=1 Tax=Streptomyces sp. MUSC 125 TaxID=1428624 RepID=UPI00057ECC44|nr:hypothetical protein [Streptomyces sp. MUSC 125]KIE25026.1 membrane protein [Streptomyces sp. MUSC 125]
MSDQPYQGGPYEGHEGYDPYQQHHPQQYPQQYHHQQHPQQQQTQAQAWPGHDDYGRQPAYDPQLTQQWQGQTWETQTHPSVQMQAPAAETAYLPPVREQQPQQPTSQQPHQPHQPQQFTQPYASQQPQQPTSQQPHQPQQFTQPYAPQQAQPQPQPHVSAPLPQPVPAPVSGPGTSGPEPVPSGPDSGPSYGPATLAGNARVTDAQRARLEGRSPIIEPGMQPAALTALLGLLLAATAPVGSYALVVPLVLLQAVTAAGWFRLNGMWPARQGIALAFAGALAADAALLAVGRDHAPAAILGTLGIWVLLSLVLQLRSHASPDERMYGLMATVASAALAILATGYLGADPHATSVGAAAVAVAVLARALPLPTPASVAVGLLAAAGAGVVVGGMTGLGAKGAVLGAGAGACALIGHRVASYDYPSRFVHFTAGVALPLSAAAPVVWVLGRALTH